MSEYSMFQVFAVTGGGDGKQGGVFCKEFTEFENAEKYRNDNNAVGNLHIKMPDGSWWPADYKVKV